MMLYLTGSKYFNVRIRKAARASGFKLTNRELIKITPRGGYAIKTMTEETIFKALGIDYVPPRYRVM